MKLIFRKVEDINKLNSYLHFFINSFKNEYRQVH